VGEPRPGPLGRVQQPPEAPQRAGAGATLGGLVALGAGVGLVFGVLGKLMS